MSLHFNLFFGKDGQFAVPIVLEDYLVNHFRSVQPNSDFLAFHNDAEGVPFAQLVVFNACRCAWILLVVVETARANLRSNICSTDIPYLNLWCATQVNASIRLFAVWVKAPIDEQLEVGIVLYRADVVPTIADVNHFAVLYNPVASHQFVGRLRGPFR